MKDSILFKLRINIPELDIYSPNVGTFSGIYNAEILVDENNSNAVSLKIFYDGKEYLDHKVMRWEGENENLMLSKFEIMDILQPDNLENISFLEYGYKGITSGTSLYRKGFKYFTIHLKGVRFIYNNSEQDNSVFFLNQQAFQLIENNYRYHSNFPWNTSAYKWKPLHKVKEFISFNGIHFKPEHYFYASNSTESVVSIKKEPKFSVQYSELTAAEIKNHILLICALYSFYSHQNITYSLSRIYTDDKLHIEVKDVEDKAVSNEHGLFRWVFFQDPLNLILQVDIPHLLENLEFVLLIIERFNYALETKGESRFMILYNILEQIRNQYILSKHIEQERAGDPPNLNRVKEEYTFTTSKKKADNFIKEQLMKVAEIIDEEHQEQFIKDVPFKLTPIKVFSMTNQFQSFFNFINIQVEDFELDFVQIKSLRDSIFHGRPVSENIELLHQINSYKRLPMFVGTVILKYFGITEVSKTKLVK
ncbi:hypothetical protein JAO76_07805 [Pontibacter sp. BT310]|uniref:ApeA N-terminal domain-containing protein n=1 Tax=Pontibacter populi TaxID=890055 RepID=A0ABS6XAB1_9BACT|nr:MULTISPECIES: hypothetical protein [Pontibacter]MBJ6118089.1 hypothetical protein [Pontibacter sp. BT310]MBR0570516.1 hypothetical protein [Microvirga sp. STS03]MBW3364942.1 hypothetical protein [Pontibacter populi]